MFGDRTIKNRRFTPKEMQDEIELAAIFRRPVRSFIFDVPTYPFIPPAPIVPMVNFNLNYKL